MSERRPVFKQLDHVVARVDEPRAVFSLLTETLGLPVAWPLKSYPSFRSGGVALGVESAGEVVVGVEDFGAAHDLWRRLYAPAAERAAGVREVDDGPALRLAAAASNSIRTLRLKVSSLARAETSLRERGMLGAVTENEITIAPSKLEGLDVRLVA